MRDGAATADQHGDAGESAPQSEGSDVGDKRDAGAAPPNGEAGGRRKPSPPIVPETKGQKPGFTKDGDDESYVEDDTLVGYDPEVVKPPAPKADDGDSSDSSDSDRRDTD